MKLPTLADFTPVQPPRDDLDGYAAWQHFGGRTAKEAYRKFCTNPNGYQEDFMFMGDRAFTYDLPVLERYLREEEPAAGFDDIARILAKCIVPHVGNGSCVCSCVCSLPPHPTHGIQSRERALTHGA